MIYLKRFNESMNLEKVKIIEVTSNSIKFDNGLTLISEHQQDCCENHYLDFSYVELSDFEGLEFNLSNESWFNRIEDYGIELVPIEGWGVRIPGYGENNGYYSTDLSLILLDEHNVEKFTFDITKCQNISG